MAQRLGDTGCSLNIFPLNFVIFLNSASSAAALVFYLPLCTLTDTEGKPRETGIYLKIFEKTQYLMNTLYLLFISNICRSIYFVIKQYLTSLKIYFP